MNPIVHLVLALVVTCLIVFIAVQIKQLAINGYRRTRAWYIKRQEESDLTSPTNPTSPTE